MRKFNLTNNFFDRLKLLCETDNIAEISRCIGVPYNTTKNYTTGRIPGGEILSVIAEHTNANINWLLTGNGTMLNPAPEPSKDATGGVAVRNVVIEIPAIKITITYESEGNPSMEFVTEQIPIIEATQEPDADGFTGTASNDIGTDHDKRSDFKRDK